MTEYQTIFLSAQTDTDLLRLVEMAEFWKIPYETTFANRMEGIAFCCSQIPSNWSSNNRTIISPRNFEDAQRIGSQHDIKVRRKRTTLALPVNKTENVHIDTAVYEFTNGGLIPKISTGKTVILAQIPDTNSYLLSLDIVGEYESQFYGGLEDQPSNFFKTFSKLPIPYRIVPRTVRDWSLRRSYNKNSRHEHNSPVTEFLRILFLACIARVSNRPIPKIGFWKKGKKYATIVTHDVETREGLLNGTRVMLEIERSLGVSSNWNIPSDRYKLDVDMLHDISKTGTIGAHDTRHDGRLILANYSEKIKRLEQAKLKLEELSGKPVQGFRSPLLQHSSELIRAVGKAGYEYDSSVPTFEIVSPTSSQPHGVETVFPFVYDGVCEVPVSLSQDHQLTRIAKLSLRESTEKILDEAKQVKILNGVCTLLLHPDYEYGLLENTDEYRGLLSHFLNDNECDFTTISKLVAWWRERSELAVKVSTGKIQLVRKQDQVPVQHGELSVEMVTAYDDLHGFKTETVTL